MGALALGDVVIRNDDIIKLGGVSGEQFQRTLEREVSKNCFLVPIATHNSMNATPLI